jgi:Patatin-like phospholipase
MSQEESNRKLLPQILAEELKHIKGREIAADAKLEEVFEKLHKEDLTAICFSGGGIRSATFGLGIVQALAKHGLLSKFDYLSTVSGGGYMGSWLSAWVRREQLLKFTANDIEADVHTACQKQSDSGIKEVEKQMADKKLHDPQMPNEEPPEMQHLRQFSNFMSPKVGFLSADTWTLVSIYFRNLFLNWTISLPLICTVLLIPRIFYAVMNLGNNGKSFLTVPSYILFIGSVVLAAFAVGYIFYELPSNKKLRFKQIRDKGNDPKIRDSETFVVLFAVLPMLILACCAVMLWAWVNLAEKAVANVADKTDKIYKIFDIYSLKFVSSTDYSKFSAISVLVLFGMLVGFVGGLGYLLANRQNLSKKHRKSQWQVLLAIPSGGVGGILIWFAAYNLPQFFNDYIYSLPLYQVFGVPIFLLMFLAAMTLFIGLSSKIIEDADREWLARFSAWVLIICGAWIILNGLVIFGTVCIDAGIEKAKIIFSSKPDGSNWLTYLFDSAKTLIVPIVGVVSGLVSLIGGYSEKSPAVPEPDENKRFSVVIKYAPPVAGIIFLGFIFAGLAYLTGFLMHYTAGFLSNEQLNNLFHTKYLNPFDSLEMFQETSIRFPVVWLLALAAFGTFMAFFVNINKFSLHAAYRDRLIRAYLGASKEKRTSDNFTNFDEKDNFQLHRLKGQKPFHVINATLNLLNGKDLAWQNRRGESFTMSALHCGSWHLGYRPTNFYSRNESSGKCLSIRYCNQKEKCCDSTDDCNMPGKALKLGTAMAISGAAANPNMGYYSSPIVTFLLALFNIRLGWWLGNPGEVGDHKDRFGYGTQYYKKSCPTVAILPLLNETLGRTDEDKRYVNVTDGGHFENLGIYEMIMRRCKFIIVSDAAADGSFKFGEISNAIEKCKVDLGVEIVFNDGLKLYPRTGIPDSIKMRNRYAVADIIYPEGGEKGTLLYLRPTYYGTEPTDILNYGNANLTFPHQTTADEMYDEKQFEAYRTLGFYTMNRIITNRDHNGLDTFFDRIKGNP